MAKYYTRACNFYYGKQAQSLIKKKKALALCGNKNVAFDQIEIFTRKNKKVSTKFISINNINMLNSNAKIIVKKHLKNITSTRKNFIKNINFSKPIIMGILNMTPDSFSDGGKFNKQNLGYKHAKNLIKQGCNILDVGGESTRPGSSEIKPQNEWNRISLTLSKLKNLKNIISLDTRKSFVMKLGIKKNAKIINDVSGLKHDPETIEVLKKTQIPFVIHHMQGNPKTMQIDPKYKNVLLDIYDFFEKKIKYIRSKGIKHNNIILDPGIGFGKKLKHNITLLRNISIFHSLGFPIMLGTSRKKFIKDLSGVNDSGERLGGTISSSLFAIMQGVQILRVHDVNEVKQSIKVFKSLKF